MAFTRPPEPPIDIRVQERLSQLFAGVECLSKEPSEKGMMLYFQEGALLVHWERIEITRIAVLNGWGIGT